MCRSVTVAIGRQDRHRIMIGGSASRQRLFGSRRRVRFVRDRPFELIDLVPGRHGAG
jgi:hypothetical protein